MNNASVTGYSISGGDHILKIGSGSITFKDLDTQNYSYYDNLVNISVKRGNNYYRYLNGAVFNDISYVSGHYPNNRTTNGTSGNDYFSFNWEPNATIKADAGDDYIKGDYVYNSMFDGGAGNDTIISTYTTASSIKGGAGRDIIKVTGQKSADSVDGVSNIIDGGDDNDVIEIEATSVIGKYEYKYSNGNGKYYTGSDTSTSNYGRRMTIIGGAGDDTIRNTFVGRPSSYSSSYSYDDDEGYSYTRSTTSYLKSADTYVTVKSYSNSDGEYNNSTITGTLIYDRTFIYNDGDGNDVIEDYHEGEKICIDGDISSASLNGSDVVLTIGDGSITLKKAKGSKISLVDTDGTTVETLISSEVTDDDSIPAGLTYNADHTILTVSNAFKGALTKYDSMVDTIDASGRTTAVLVMMSLFMLKVMVKLAISKSKIIMSS